MKVKNKFMAMISSEHLTEYEAAQEVKISPELLRWFTSYSPKGDGKKLSFEMQDGVYYFHKKELLEFNAYLNLPWPKPNKGIRPTIPAGISSEVRKESHYHCPLCNTNIGELAHIKPVSQTFNNHPHNLIYLCPNHHTIYDYGYKYNNISEEDLLVHKKALQNFQAQIWSLKSRIVFSYISLINKIGRVKELEAVLHKSVDRAEFEKLLNNILDKIESVDQNSTQSSTATILVKSIKSKGKKRTIEDAYSLLTARDELKDEYNTKKNYMECPVCNSNGSTDYFEICPGCAGEGYVDRNTAVNFAIYELKKCPLCKGDGRGDFDECPTCGGEGKMTMEQISITDFSLYDLIKCPLCKGRGSTKDFDVCPPCGGEGKLTTEQVDSIDFTAFTLEDCPLCEGSGSTDDFDVCPPCGGDGQLTREQMANIDFDKFKASNCPLCNGNGSTKEFDVCPACHGSRRLTKEEISMLDLTQFKLKKCPLCKGRGETKKYEVCPACQGEGELMQKEIDEINFSDFD